jgi:hypothetical protein
MSSSSAYTGSKQPDFINQDKSDLPVQTGIFKGIIKAIDTGARAGRLWVYISEFGGSRPNDDNNWKLVSYASPFNGSTTGPPGGQQLNSYRSTKQTYGFFMTPPDLGNIVLCCFPEGANGEGYWFACINPDLSRYMVPANGAVPWDKIDGISFEDPAVQRLSAFIKPGNPYPVGEFNLNNSDVYTPSWATSVKYPINPILTEQLVKQGLDSDLARGPIITSSQRDPISTVFGFSSPGRPTPGQDPKNMPNIEQKIASGNFNPSEFVVTNRVGGHSLVFDDGDFKGNSNLVRIKSSAGHQILMHDTEGFIYVSNAAGSAWVELTKEGDVLIYSQRDIALRSKANIQMHSDQNISFNAGRGIQLKAAGDISMEAGRLMQASGGQYLNLYGKSTQLKSGGVMAIQSGGAIQVKATSTLQLAGKLVALGGAGGAGDINPPSKLTSYLSPDSTFTPQGWTIRTGALSSICYKIPTHEPYIRGNINAVIESQQQEDNLDAEIQSSTTVYGEQIQVTPITNSDNLDQARLQDVKRPAPTSAFLKQPDPGQGIGNLDNDQLRAYMAQIGHTESSGKYNAVNQYGYAGKYQMGSAALQDLGYVKVGTPQTPEALANPSNWVGGPGKPSGLDDFLANKDIQETAMFNYTKQNYATLQKKGVITGETDTADVAGLLSSSHLVGPGATVKFVQGGIDAKDANGTTASQYYNQGRYSISQVPKIQASNASKTVMGG